MAAGVGTRYRCTRSTRYSPEVYICLTRWVRRDTLGAFCVCHIAVDLIFLKQTIRRLLQPACTPPQTRQSSSCSWRMRVQCLALSWRRSRLVAALFGRARGQAAHLSFALVRTAWGCARLCCTHAVICQLKVFHPSNAKRFVEHCILSRRYARHSCRIREF